MLSDFSPGEPKKEEGVHGPAGAQSGDPRHREQRLPQEDREARGLEHEPHAPAGQAAGARLEDAPAAGAGRQVSVAGTPNIRVSSITFRFEAKAAARTCVLKMGRACTYDEELSGTCALMG